MNIPDSFTRSKSLNNIPYKKVIEALNRIEGSEAPLEKKNNAITLIHRYHEANIPLEYWGIKMERDFVGDPRLLDKYNQYVNDIKGSYLAGKCLCLNGTHGVGKTFALTCILKRACQKGFVCLYCNLSDIVSTLIDANREDKHLARQELIKVDFLVIDELDIRYFNNSDLAKDLFARSFETILRNRTQNKLPILFATNSPNFNEMFNNLFKESLSSLMNKIDVFTVMPGEDFRNKGKNQ